MSNRLLSGFVSPLVSKYADNHDIDALLMAIGIAMEGISAALFALAFVFTSQVYEIILIAVVILGIAQSFYH
ncbi:MAG: MFS transporter, partial [Thermoplasmata archaeon]